MTEPAPMTDVLSELRLLRETVERAINTGQIVSERADDAVTNMERIEAKSDRRARRFMWLWSLLALLMVSTVIAGIVVAANDDRHRRCFQDFANDTAERTELLTDASNKRISALDAVLEVRADGGTNQQVAKAAKTAVELGRRYEELAKKNPPIPPERLDCAD